MEGQWRHGRRGSRREELKEGRGGERGLADVRWVAGHSWSALWPAGEEVHFRVS
jgi:hypothetical protein